MRSYWHRFFSRVACLAGMAAASLIFSAHGSAWMGWLFALLVGAHSVLWMWVSE